MLGCELCCELLLLDMERLGCFVYVEGYGVHALSSTGIGKMSMFSLI